MDEMKIVSKFMRTVISKIIKVTLNKKLGYNVDIQLNEINVVFDEKKAHVHLNGDAELSKDELVKLLKSIGLI